MPRRRSPSGKRRCGSAEIDLERTSIRSPIDGTVISRTIDIGQTVAASLQAPELFKIAQDLRRIQIEAQVNEADVGVIKEGNPAEFIVDAYPEERFEGVVTQVRLAAIELQNVVTYTVIIEARNDDRRLFPGMTANVQIETAKRAGIMRVANDALRFKPRDQSAEQEMRDPAQAAARAQRVVEQMKTSLKLSEEQTATLVAAMQQFAAERAASRQQGGAQPRRAPGGRRRERRPQPAQPVHGTPRSGGRTHADGRAEAAARSLAQGPQGEPYGHRLGAQCPSSSSSGDRCGSASATSNTSSSWAVASSPAIAS